MAINGMTAYTYVLSRVCTYIHTQAICTVTVRSVFPKTAFRRVCVCVCVCVWKTLPCRHSRYTAMPRRRRSPLSGSGQVEAAAMAAQARPGLASPGLAQIAHRACYNLRQVC